MMIGRICAGLAVVVGLTLSSVTARAEEKPAKDVVATAVEAGKFKTLVAAVQAAGLVETLQGKGPFTVFAPTDEAFAKLPAGTVENLLKPENKDQLVAVLKYHVVAGRVTSAELLKAKEAKSLQGGVLKASVDQGKAKVNTSNIVAVDIGTSNGVIHVIDSVLLPPADSKGASVHSNDKVYAQHTCPNAAGAATRVVRVVRQ